MESTLSLLCTEELSTKMFMHQDISGNTVTDSNILWKGPSLYVVECLMAVIKLNKQHFKLDTNFAIIMYFSVK